MRAFFGIPLDDALRERLVEAQADLRIAGADVLWVKPECLHLTLQFLGEIPESTRIHVDAGPSFDLQLHGVGEFRARVVWAGCRGAPRELAHLVSRVEAEADRIGIERDRRPFQAHVTLGRIKHQRGLQALRHRMAEWKDRDFGTWPVRKVVLFRSERQADGSVYKVVAEYPCIAR